MIPWKPKADDVVFSDEFKALWDDESPIRQMWVRLESLYKVLSDVAVEDARRADNLEHNSRSLKLERDIEQRNRPMEEILLEFIGLCWFRLVLRGELKARDALRLLFSACNSANALGCAMAARAIIEHVALLEYFAARAPWRREPDVSENHMKAFVEDLQQLLIGSRFPWDSVLGRPGELRRLLDSGNPWDRPKNERIPDIRPLVDSLDHRLFELDRLAAKGHVRFVYTILSDVVHPSWGGEIAYCPQLSGQLNANPQLDEHFELLAELFCGMTEEAVAHLLRLRLETLNDRPMKIIADPKSQQS